jgi:predicted HAD superfamily Cof-like phosphohydrolase
MTERDKVKVFHEVTGQSVKSRPEMPDEATRLLRCRLLLEEALEFIKASGFKVVRCCDMPQCHAHEIVPDGQPDLAAMAQENADIRYLTHGNDFAMGVDGRVFDEVHAANMRKAPGGVVTRRPDGKVVKPEGWKPPDVARVLEEWDLDADPRELSLLDIAPK